MLDSDELRITIDTDETATPEAAPPHERFAPPPPPPPRPAHPVQRPSVPGAEQRPGAGKRGEESVHRPGTAEVARAVLGSTLESLLPRTFARLSQQQSIWKSIGEKIAEPFEKAVSQAAERLEGERQSLQSQYENTPQERQGDFLKGLTDRQTRLLSHKGKITPQKVRAGIKGVVAPAAGGSAARAAAGAAGGAGRAAAGAASGSAAGGAAAGGAVAGLAVAAAAAAAVIGGITVSIIAMNKATDAARKNFSNLAESHAGNFSPEVLMARQEIAFNRRFRDVERGQKFGAAAAGALRQEESLRIAKEDLSDALAQFGQNIGLPGIADLGIFVREKLTALIDTVNNGLDFSRDSSVAIIEAIDKLIEHLSFGQVEDALRTVVDRLEAIKVETKEARVAREERESREAAKRARALSDKWLSELFRMEMPGEFDDGA